MSVSYAGPVNQKKKNDRSVRTSSQDITYLDNRYELVQWKRRFRVTSLHTRSQAFDFSVVFLEDDRRSDLRSWTLCFCQGRDGSTSRTCSVVSHLHRIGITRLSCFFSKVINDLCPVDLSFIDISIMITFQSNHILMQEESDATTQISRRQIQSFWVPRNTSYSSSRLLDCFVRDVSTRT